MRTKYTKEIIQKAVIESTSVSAVIRHFGLSVTGASHQFFKRLIKYYEIPVTHFVNTNYGKSKPSTSKLHYNKILVKNRRKTKEQPVRLRRALIESGVEYRCFKCQIQDWNSKPIMLEIHHLNEDTLDNTIENLVFLCPNCHSQVHNSCEDNTKTKVTPSKPKYNCSNCGKKCYCKKSQNKLCKKCSTIQRRSHIPSKEQLIKDFMELKSFVKVADKYDISDNGIRKWHKIYDLPIKTKEVINLVH